MPTASKKAPSSKLKAPSYDEAVKRALTTNYQLPITNY